MITRPAIQAEAISRRISTSGGQAIHFPTIEIAACSEEQNRKVRAIDLSSFAGIIFVSRNAVIYANRIIPELNKQVRGIPVFAVGPGTGEELEKHGFTGIFYAAREAGSEALLELEQLQERFVLNKKILIIRGVGGRELIREVLQQRGAQIQYAEVYCRQIPEYDCDLLKNIWQNIKPDIIVVTSTEGLKNLFEMTDPADRNTLLNTPLVVISQRMKKTALAMGFLVTPQVTDSANDEGLLHAILHTAGLLPV